MKNRVATLDIVVLIKELREKLVGHRFDQIYDIDKKTYLIRLSKTNTKRTLLIESGARFHTTSFEWPKNPAPSGFTMKLRKHLNNKRLESIRQVGADRVVDFQFGAEAFAVHLLLELYDKGNIILTDQDYNILSLVRPHIQGEDRLVAHEKYTIDKAKQCFSLSQEEMASLALENGGKTIREIFLPRVEFGPALFTHVLREVGLSLQSKIPAEPEVEFQEKLFTALETGRKILEAPEKLEPGGFIVTQQQKTPAAGKGKGNEKEKDTNEIGSASTPALVIYDQYQPMILVSDFPAASLQTYPGLDETLDEFYSKLEAQKLDMRQLNQEREAYKKLDRVRDDQKHRLQELKLIQEIDRRKAELIIAHQSLVDSAIGILRALVANQIPWDDIAAQIKEATVREDPIASHIKGLQLLKNQFTMKLKYESDEEEEEDGTPRKDKDQFLDVELDLDLSAYANAARFFDLKKASAKKEERTLESQTKAFKSTERKTLSSLREVATMQSIKKARKVYWFEKFHWFVSSENHLVLGGHDAQQNELLVKRYMGPYDVYLHADTHGAPTIIVKTGVKSDSTSPPPKTLHEAGTLAVCASGSWETKIISTCWWVWGHQVSKSAPTGEYLPTGSFMIRGRKNYLPPCQLILGFGFLFRVTDECVAAHRGERSVRGAQAPSEKSESEAEAEPEVEPEREDMPPMSSDSESESCSDGDGDGEEAFPDTQIPVKLPGAGPRTRTISSMSSEYSMSTVTTALSGTDLDGDGTDNYTIVQSGVLPQFSADATKQKQKQKGGAAGKKGGQAPQKGKGQGQSKGQAPPTSPGGDKDDDDEPQSGKNKNANANNVNDAPAKPKRGQHGRQKKLKEKYKFQDDDEREMRMQLLQSKGKAQAAAETSKQGPMTAKEGSVEGPSTEEKPKASEQKPKPAKPDRDEAPEPEPEPEPLEIDVLDSLTGCPLEQDELLFAIPVIAPYAALTNYKYRIKLIPGTTKRGKAAKYAMELFVRDKTARPRERDLIKSVKDQDTARNFPGKVKLAAGAVDHKKK